MADQTAPLDVIGDLGAHATNYAAGGMEIFPVDPASKRPMAAVVPRAPSQHSATADVEVVAEWWRRWPTALIGHRLPDNHVIIDVDPRHGGSDTWDALRKHLGIESPATRIHMSGRGDGGGHITFLRPKGKLAISAMDDWAREHGTGHAVVDRDGNPTGGWVCGLDLLQRNHRYTILPPSPHPDTGKPYRWHSWVEPIAMPEPLAALLVDNRPPPPPYEPKPYDGESIADWYTARHGLAQLLSRHGWTLRRGNGDDDGSQWQHPHATSPVSATVRHGCLFVYSPNTEFPVTAPGDANGITPFRAYALLEHGGDTSAAAGAARRTKSAQDGPKPRTAPSGVNPFTGEVMAPQITADDADDGPVPLEADHLTDLPPFPLHVLPDWMADEARHAADALQVPVEMTGFLGLLALSICVSGKVEVDAINWRQPLNIYGTVVAPSGTGKSPAAERMLAPIRDLEVELAAAVADKVAYSEAKASGLAAAIADAEKSLKGDPSSTSLTQQLADTRRDANDHRVLSAYRLTVDDHTPEALSQTIAGQVDERIAVISPEGASLFESMTGKRYKDAASIPSVPDVYLKAWSGEQISVDRVGRPALVIRRPILTVCVMVQPDIVSGLAASPMIARQGGLARFLWVVGDDIVGQRDRKRRRHAQPPSSEYRDNILAIGRHAARNETKAVYVATEEAADVIDDLANEREDRLGFGGDLEAHRIVEAKMTAYHWRLAGLLAVAFDDPIQGGLTAQRARQATELVDYFMAHAVSVHNAAGLSEASDATWRTMAAWCLKHAGETVTPRDMWIGLRSNYPKVGDLVPDIEHLVSMRWLTVVDGDLIDVGVQRRPNPNLVIDARITRNGSRSVAKSEQSNAESVLRRVTVNARKSLSNTYLPTYESSLGARSTETPQPTARYAPYPDQAEQTAPAPLFERPRDDRSSFPSPPPIPEVPS